MEGWSGDPGWQALNGEMLHDGSNNNVLTPLLAPIILSTSDYAVEADVVPGRWEECFCNRGIFLVARYDKSKGVYYFGQMDSAREMGIFENSGGPPNDISSIPSSVKAGSLLTLRAEVKGNSLKLIVDGRLLIDTTDNRVLTAGRVGIACSENQGTVRRFEVSAL